MEQYIITIKEMLIKRIDTDQVISRAELARELGISKAAVTLWLQLDDKTIPSPKYYADICRLLKITPNDLFGFKSNISSDELRLLEAYKANPEMKEAIKTLLKIN